MEIYNCVSLLELLCAAPGAVTPVLFSLHLLLNLSSPLPHACPLYEILFFIQNPLSPLLFPGHNLKFTFFKEPKVVFLTQKIPYLQELHSQGFEVLRGTICSNKHRHGGEKNGRGTLAIFSLMHNKGVALSPYSSALHIMFCSHARKCPWIHLDNKRIFCLHPRKFPWMQLDSAMTPLEG